MKDIFQFIPIVLYGILGIVSLVMAFKSLFSIKFISFHEKAAAKSWEDLDNPLQFVILAMMKVSGLGFLVVAILMLVFPVINYFRPDSFIKYAVPATSFVFCTGLFLVNYYLYKRTKAMTPWRGSLAAMLFIVAGIILSAVHIAE